MSVHILFHLKMLFLKAREMTQCSTALEVPIEDLSSVPSTLMGGSQPLEFPDLLLILPASVYMCYT